jgi:hypothetical protein
VLKIKEPGQFEAVVTPPNKGLGYIFHFDRDAPGAPGPTAAVAHAFAAAGRHTAYVEVGRLVKGKTGLALGEVLGRSNDAEVQVGEPPQVQLSPTQLTAQEGETVWFTVSMSDGSDPGGFQFEPGEKWDGSGQIMHGSRIPYQFKHPGLFRASASIDGAGSAFSNVTISAKPVAWWIFAVAGLAVLAAAGGVAKVCHIFPFRPAVSFRALPGKQPELRPGKHPPGVAFAICLKPNLAASQGKVRAKAPLIKTQTKIHD